jgi:8-oxo-dGTP pyrophosphatase MutT (NUDIX family)
MQADSILRDGEEIEVQSKGQDWLSSWHPAFLPPPQGRNHGAAGICITPDGLVVLVSEDGFAWDIPAGRPEPGETLRQTLDREMLEETCGRVQDASLLGYFRGLCIRGHEQGLILVRSFWRANIELDTWDPQHEIIQRRLVTPAEALDEVGSSSPWAPWRRVFARAFYEAGLL